ncbi:MAG: hypothetical protein M1823_000810 [Watsoniomyces obsoletus]|nr:MAG: hypothetical protein M1823_000810 [Watsoniomyces obsoletus]
MGLFSRKNSKPSIHSETLSIETDGGSHLSKASTAKSPMSVKEGNGWPTPYSSINASEPELLIPNPIDPAVDPAGYLRGIHAVRERSQLVFQKARKNELVHFNVDLDKFAETAAYVVSIIKRDYAPDYASIPPHGRWQHFDVGGRPRIDQLLASWPSTVDAQERTRRLLDLFLVSVLLDAGAGARWQYRSKQSGKIYRRSEGLAVASLEMFTAGSFSSDHAQPCQVDATGLKGMTVDKLAKGLQVSESNPIAGLDGRAGLLIRLGQALENQRLFGTTQRPGNMLDYLLNHPQTQMASVPIIPVPTLWSVLMGGLASIWPESRTQIGGVPLGDAWPCLAMPASPPSQPWENIVPFHKLTQWLTYSLMAPMSKILRIRFSGVGLLTGLPEYRNGGLLIDTGLLTLKPSDLRRGLDAFEANAKIAGQPKVEVVPLFRADDDVIVEWRAVTIGFLDELLVEVNRLLGLRGGDALMLAQMLEAGTWKGGRELAEVSRPNTKEPPIMIVSDGTVF